MPKLHKSLFQSAFFAYGLLTLLCFLVLHLMLGRVLYHPGEYFFSAGGDGIKAYYGLFHYVWYGKGWYMEGMQYPFSVHIAFADIISPLAIILHQIHHHIQPLSESQILCIFHLSFVFSPFICAYALLAIFRRMKLPLLMGVLASLIITFLSPQVARWEAHFSLGFLFFVPVLWLMILRMYEEKRGSKTALFLFVQLFAFIHPYYALIGGGFVLMYALVYLWQDGIKGNMQLLFQSFVLAILPLIGLRLWLFVTVFGATDSVTTPYGFMEYHASFESIFTPHQGPFLDLLSQFIGIRKPNHEGYAYVSLVGTFVLILSIIRFIQRIIQKQHKRLKQPNLPKELRTSIWAASFLLIVAMGIPFVWLPQLLDVVPFIQQFRSIGRVAWVFFYVYAVFATYYLYRLHRYIRWEGGGKMKWVGISILSLAALVASMEMTLHLQKTRKIARSVRIASFEYWQVDFEQLLGDEGYAKSDFQAILSLPYYHIGSEKWQIDGSWGSQVLSFRAGSQMGLPLCNVMSARVPLSYAASSIQLISHPILPKEIIRQFPNQKPLLILAMDKGELSVGEQYLLSQSELITASQSPSNAPGLRLYKLPLDHIQQISPSIPSRDSLHSLNHSAQHQLFATADIQKPFVWDAFGDEIGHQATEQAFYSDKQHQILLDTSFSTQTFAAGEYEFSCWMKVDPHTHYLPIVEVRMFDELHEGNQQWQEIYSRDLGTKYSEDVLGDWTKFSERISLPSGKRLEIKVKAKGVWIDDLLIRPAESDMWFLRSDSSWYWNNYPIP